jgi:negative regulator of sigma-B (phosphoserine phosphatase)
MIRNRDHDQSSIEWAVAGRALGGSAGAKESGDLHVVAPFPGGVLVAVIDGLGHGTEAAQAACAAAEVLQAHADQCLTALIQRCHTSLRQSRGAVMTLVAFNSAESSITSIGVGNVDAVLLRANSPADCVHAAVLLRGGIVGYQLPPLRATSLSVRPGDTLMIATDGIRTGFTDGVNVRQSPQQIAESILSLHGKASDDSLVLVVRFLG